MSGIGVNLLGVTATGRCFAKMGKKVKRLSFSFVSGEQS